MRRLAVQPFHTSRRCLAVLPSAQLSFRSTQVNVVGIAHGDSSLKSIQKIICSLPPDAAVAVETNVLYSLRYLRFSCFDGATPLPHTPFNDQHLAVDADLELVAEYQAFLVERFDTKRLSTGIGRYRRIVGAPEFTVAVEAAQAMSLPVWLVDMPEDARFAKLPALHAQALASSWFGTQPLCESAHGAPAAPRLGVPSWNDCRKLVRHGVWHEMFLPT